MTAHVAAVALTVIAAADVAAVIVDVANAMVPKLVPLLSLCCPTAKIFLLLQYIVAGYAHHVAIASS